MIIIVKTKLLFDSKLTMWIMKTLLVVNPATLPAVAGDDDLPPRAVNATSWNLAPSLSQLRIY